jgi:hypothetical protein
MNISVAVSPFVSFSSSVIQLFPLCHCGGWMGLSHDFYRAASLFLLMKPGSGFNAMNFETLHSAENGEQIGYFDARYILLFNAN